MGLVGERFLQLHTQTPFFCGLFCNHKKAAENTRPLLAKVGPDFLMLNLESEVFGSCGDLAGLSGFHTVPVFDIGDSHCGQPPHDPLPCAPSFT